MNTDKRDSKALFLAFYLKIGVHLRLHLHRTHTCSGGQYQGVQVSVVENSVSCHAERRFSGAKHL